MEKKEEEKLNSAKESGRKQSDKSDWERRFNYDQKNVRNLKIDEILTRMCALRQQPRSFETVTDSSGPSTSTQDWRSSMPSTSSGSKSSLAEKRFISYPKFSRENSPPEMIVNQLPAGCIRTIPSSQELAAGMYTRPSRTQFFNEGASTSGYGVQSHSSPVSPRMLVPRPRKTSLPGHPFGLGSEKSSRSHLARDSVPIEFIKDIKEESGIPINKYKLDKTGKPDKSDERVEYDEEKEAISSNSP